MPHGRETFSGPVYGRALAALVLWGAVVAGALVGTEGGFAGWHLPLAVLYLPVVFLVAFSLAGACAGYRGSGRLFWGMMCAGVLLYLAGSPLWSPARGHGPPFSVVCYAVGVLLLFGALLLGIFAVSRRAGYVAWADALAVGLSLGVLFSVFVVSPAELAVAHGWPEALVALSLIHI